MSSDQVNYNTHSQIIIPSYISIWIGNLLFTSDVNFFFLAKEMESDYLKRQLVGVWIQAEVSLFAVVVALPCADRPLVVFSVSIQRCQVSRELPPIVSYWPCF